MEEKKTRTVFVKMEMVELTDHDEFDLKRSYPGPGRYLVRYANGDMAVTDVQDYPKSDDPEQKVHAFELFIGTPTFYDEEDLVCSGEVDAARERYESEIEGLEKDFDDMADHHDKELSRLKDSYEESIRQLKESHKETFDLAVASKTEEMRQEYEMKKLQLDLETPKRFAQGEWVSGKTLTEIVKTLVGERKEA